MPSPIRVPALPRLRFRRLGQLLEVGQELAVAVTGETGIDLELVIVDDALSIGGTAGGIPVRAHLDAASNALTVRGGSAASPLMGVAAARSRLRVLWIECVLQLRDDDGDGTLDTLESPDAVTLTGEIEWTDATSVGLPDRTRLGLGWVDGHLQLSLPHDVEWPTHAPVLKLAAGSRLAARVVVQNGEPALDLLLSGTVQAVGNAADLLDRIGGMVEQIVGHAPALTDPRDFRLRQRFRVPDPAGGGVEPLWSATRLRCAVELGDLAALPTAGGFLAALGLRVDLGRAALDLTIPAADHATDPAAWSDWTIRLTDAAIGFPDVAGLEIPTLRGDLRVDGFDPTDPDALALAFEPAAMQALELPDVLRFLLARLRLLPSTLRLDDLAEQLAMALPELDWLDLLRGTVGGSPDAMLLQTVAANAQAVGVEPARLFRLAFQAIAELGDEAARDDWARVAWQALDAVLTTGELPAVAARILRELAELGGELLAVAARALCAALELLSIAVRDVVQAFVALLVQAPADGLDDALVAFVRFVAAAVAALDDPTLASDFVGALVDLLTPAGRPPELAAPAPDGSGLAWVEWLIGRALSALAIGAGDLLAPPGWDAIPGLGKAAADGLRQLAAGIDVAMADVIAMFRGFLDGLVLDEITDPAERELAIGREWALLNLVRQYPPTALLLIPAAILASIPRWPGVFSRFVGNNVEEDPSLQTDRLPAGPGGRKFLIVSDMHRDAESDDAGVLQFGSIDHFKDNRQLYACVVRWAKHNGYTLVENGDSEELWYIREAWEHPSPKSKLLDILQSNGGIYADLWELHAEGRYLRIIGNHDSYVRDMMQPESRNGVQRPWFQWAWWDAAKASRPSLASSPDSVAPFRLLDFLVIDGVKTMDEHDLFAAVGDSIEVVSDPAAAVRSLIEGRLGMDAAAYTDRRPMLVCHGHQFDVWNNDATGLIGKLISNGVGVPVDRLTDPFLDLKGIAVGGSPFLDFRNLLARVPVANSWLAQNVAVRMAHEIQHQDDESRLPIDDVMFSESLALLFGNYLMPLRPDPTDPSSNRALWDGGVFPNGAVFNHLCIGHTHIPQSQPYLLIPDPIAGPLRPAVAAVQAGLAAVLPVGAPELLVDEGIRLPIRSRFYNTGTGSWFRGVIWAIEITASGQARSVYFTENSIGPETMDWELDELQDDVRNAMNALPGTALDWLGDQFARAAALLGDRFTRVVRSLTSAVAPPLPLPALVAAYSDPAGTVELALERLDDLDAGASLQQRERVRQQCENLQGFAVRLVSTLLRRLQQPTGTTVPDAFVVRLPVDAEAARRFDALLELFGDIAGDEVQRVASAVFLALHRLPMLGADAAALPSGSRFAQGRAPLMSLLLALAAALPFGADGPVLGGIRPRASLTLDDGTLVLRVDLEVV